MMCETYYFLIEGTSVWRFFAGNSSFRGMQSRSHTIGSLHTCEDWKGANLVSNESSEGSSFGSCGKTENQYWFRRILISEIRAPFAKVSNLANHADSYFWEFNSRSKITSECYWKYCALDVLYIFRNLCNLYVLFIIFIILYFILVY